MIAFDSNVLIYWLHETGEYKERAGNVFRRIQLQSGVCSTLVVTEVIYGNINSVKDIPLLTSKNIQILPTVLEISELAGKIRKEFSIKTIDAIHIATAIYSGASEFVTNDQYLLKKKIPGIKIRGL